MLYVGIDQHAGPLTVSLRNEVGDVVLARQVSTEPDRVRAFFDQLTRDRGRDGESFVAVLDVCGFNDWLIRMLRDSGCANVILIRPEDRKKRKADGRDAAARSELLWANRGPAARCSEWSGRPARHSHPISPRRAGASRPSRPRVSRAAPREGMGRGQPRRQGTVAASRSDDNRTGRPGASPPRRDVLAGRIGEERT